MNCLPSPIRIFPFLLALLVATSCGPTTPSETPAAAPDTPRPVVYTGSYALAYFAQRIGGDDFTVIFPVPAGEEPEEWMPDDDTIAALQQADLILLNGADFESWPDKIMLPEGLAIDTSAGMTDRFLEVEDAVTHRHGPHGVHSHAGTASIIWLDPQLADQQAVAVEAALAALRPELADDLAARGTDLRQDLAQLDQAWQEALEPLEDQPLLASHPVYHYLADRYGLELPSVHWEPTENPSDREWQNLDRRLRRQPVAWMIWEDTPRPETAGELDRRGIGIIVIDPIFHPPAEGDFLSAMQENIGRVRRALPGQDPAP